MTEKLDPDPFIKIKISASLDQQSEMFLSLFLLYVQVVIYRLY